MKGFVISECFFQVSGATDGTQHPCRVTQSKRDTILSFYAAWKNTVRGFKTLIMDGQAKPRVPVLWHFNRFKIDSRTAHRCQDAPKTAEGVDVPLVILVDSA